MGRSKYPDGTFVHKLPWRKELKRQWHMRTYRFKGGPKCWLLGHRWDDDLELRARCGGGWVGCKRCGTFLRHYSCFAILRKDCFCGHHWKGPWIPDPKEVAKLREDLDVALASDFAVKVLDERP